MNIQVAGNQLIPLLSKRDIDSENDYIDIRRVKNIKNSRIRGDYLIDFLRVSEKLFYFEKMINQTLFK